MDLNAVTSIDRPTTRNALGSSQPGDAWLAGGTWLFSEPQPTVTRLIDLSRLDWPALTTSDGGLSIAATCPVATLHAFEAPPAWLAAPLIGLCCESFLASFKIWTMATVGGNLCIALPAGPMISMAVALDGECLVWTQDGGERRIAARDFVLGPQHTVLQAGDLLRRIDLPAEAMKRRFAFRRLSLTPLGRSGALLVGTRTQANAFALTVTASTPRPVQLRFDEVPEAATLRTRLAEAIPAEGYYDDIHGRPDWRRHVTHELAEEIRRELAGPAH